ncbi:hypothetical protein NE237_018053 [Protea cynaroides]|uniref:Lipin N-terminal domain-containing protein n=1 Tax=Protea cynaroides TaxID=273540 RepID=A0A9Q0K984_9MAGN|nr:hypothetical protein NE237_018053 [Protea cynaroides]
MNPRSITGSIPKLFGSKGIPYCYAAGGGGPSSGVTSCIAVAHDSQTTPAFIKKSSRVISPHSPAREKVISITVNGVDAEFHMYLDHKGEAYFEPIWIIGRGEPICICESIEGSGLSAELQFNFPDGLRGSKRRFCFVCNFVVEISWEKFIFCFTNW